MRLFELFDDYSSVLSQMRSTVMDILTPVAANGVESVSLSALMKKLEEVDAGIVLDRDLALKILNPDIIRLITKVEGDRVYLDQPSKISSSSNERETIKKVKRVKKMATKAAKKRIK